MDEYKIIDYKNLVTLWYNEFLPEAIDDNNKSVFVEDVGVLYIKSIPLESKRAGTVEFMLEKIRQLSGNCIGLFVQEPKPVNNAKTTILLKTLEGMGISKDRMERVLHFANRRYVPMSGNIAIPQSKEIDEFLDSVFLDLNSSSKTCFALPNWRTYSIQSLGIGDFVEVAKSFFPKKYLTIQPELVGEHVQILSANDVIWQLRQLAILSSSNMDLDAVNFISNYKQTILRDLEMLV